MVSRGLTEYLQMDLLQMHVVTAIRTQGRFGKGQGQEYSEAYVIEYWRPGFDKWVRWRNNQGKEVIYIFCYNILIIFFFKLILIGTNHKKVIKICLSLHFFL